MKKRLSLCMRYWSKCNNKCSFCFEDNTSFDRLKYGMFKEPSVFAIKENNLKAKEIIDSGDYDFFTFKLMGGELFNVTEKRIIEELVNTIKWIHSVYKDHNLLKLIYDNRENSTETLVIASNLMYNDRRAILSCLNVLKDIDYIAASSMFSFDLYGRFNSEKTLKQYYDNILFINERYNDVLKIIPSFVLSKQNMNIISDDKDTPELKVFKELYDMGLSFDIQLLLNDCHIGNFSYTRDELNRFIDKVCDRYPRLLGVFQARSMYKKYNTIRKTIQCAEIIEEESLFNNSKVKECLICDKYKTCHHSYSDISYNATECDAKEFLNRCN